MCGRYSLIADIQELARQFEFDGTGFEDSPRYNVAPTQAVLTVTNRDARHAEYMRWGPDPFLGQGRFHRQPHDQRPGRNGGSKAQLPERPPASPLPGPGRRVLRVAEGGQGQTTHAHRPQVPRTLCLCRFVGDLAQPRGERPSAPAPSSLPRPTTCSGPSTNGCL